MRKVKRLDGLSDRVRQLLFSWQGTQEDLAEELGISRTMLQNWMNIGANPSAYYLAQICRCFDVSADWLLGLSDRKERT